MPGLGRAVLLTQVPIGSPAMARSMFPSFLKLNTRIGNWFSRHMPMAVMSMTLSSSRITCSKVRCSIEDGVRVFLGIGRVDAVDAGRLEQDLGAELLAAERGRGVGRDERASRAGGQDDHAPFVEVGQGPAADERLGHFVHADRGQEPRRTPLVLERVLQGQAVDHGRRHAHVMGGRLLDHVGAAGKLGAAEDVSTPHDDRQLNAPRTRPARSAGRSG